MEIGTNGHSWLIRVSNESEHKLAEKALRLGSSAVFYGQVHSNGLIMRIPIQVAPSSIKVSIDDSVEYPFEYGPLDSSRIMHGIWAIAEYTEHQDSQN